MAQLAIIATHGLNWGENTKRVAPGDLNRATSPAFAFRKIQNKSSVSIQILHRADPYM